MSNAVFHSRTALDTDGAEGSATPPPPDAAPAAASAATKSVKALLEPSGDIARATRELLALNSHMHASQEAAHRVAVADMALATARTDAAIKVAGLDAGIIAAKMGVVRVMEKRDDVAHRLYREKKRLTALSAAEEEEGGEESVEVNGDGLADGDGDPGTTVGTEEEEKNVKRCQVLAAAEMERLRVLDEELVRAVEEHEKVKLRREKAETALREAYEDF